jgi:hypothetical protein
LKVSASVSKPLIIEVVSTSDILRSNQSLEYKVRLKPSDGLEEKIDGIVQFFVGSSHKPVEVNICAVSKTPQFIITAPSELSGGMSDFSTLSNNCKLQSVYLEPMEVRKFPLYIENVGEVPFKMSINQTNSSNDLISISHEAWFASSRVKKLMANLKESECMEHRQSAVLLLKHCYGSLKLNHILRCSATHAIAAEIEEMDKSQYECLDNLLCSRITPFRFILSLQ